MSSRHEIEARIEELERKITEALDEAQWFHANSEARRRDNNPDMAKEASDKAQHFVDLHNVLVSELDGLQKRLEALSKRS